MKGDGIPSKTNSIYAVIFVCTLWYTRSFAPCSINAKLAGTYENRAGIIPLDFT